MCTVKCQRPYWAALHIDPKIYGNVSPSRFMRDQAVRLMNCTWEVTFFCNSNTTPHTVTELMRYFLKLLQVKFYIF
jgi:hypothetical protein